MCVVTLQVSTCVVEFIKRLVVQIQVSARARCTFVWKESLCQITRCLKYCMYTCYYSYRMYMYVIFQNIMYEYVA